MIPQGTPAGTRVEYIYGNVNEEFYIGRAGVLTKDVTEARSVGWGNVTRVQVSFDDEPNYPHQILSERMAILMGPELPNTKPTWDTPSQTPVIVAGGEFNGRTGFLYGRGDMWTGFRRVHIPSYPHADIMCVTVKTKYLRVLSQGELNNV